MAVAVVTLRKILGSAWSLGLRRHTEMAGQQELAIDTPAGVGGHQRLMANAEPPLACGTALVRRGR